MKPDNTSSLRDTSARCQISYGPVIHRSLTDRPRLRAPNLMTRPRQRVHRFSPGSADEAHADSARHTSSLTARVSASGGF
jgi:hypothetical protein